MSLTTDIPSQLVLCAFLFRFQRKRTSHVLKAGCFEHVPTVSAPDVNGVIEAVVDAGRPNIGAGRIAQVEKVDGVPVNARLAAVAKLHILHLK
jgi:hypothetical protein